MEVKNNDALFFLYHFLWCGHQMVPCSKTKYLPYDASSQTHHLFPEQSRTLTGRNHNQGLENKEDWQFNKYSQFCQKGKGFHCSYITFIFHSFILTLKDAIFISFNSINRAFRKF